MPPLGGGKRLHELGPLLPQDMLVEGDSWQESSIDVAIAGKLSQPAHACINAIVHRLLLPHRHECLLLLFQGFCALRVSCPCFCH